MNWTTLAQNFVSPLPSSLLSSAHLNLLGILSLPGVWDGLTLKTFGLVVALLERHRTAQVTPALGRLLSISKGWSLLHCGCHTSPSLDLLRLFPVSPRWCVRELLLTESYVLFLYSKMLLFSVCMPCLHVLSLRHMHAVLLAVRRGSQMSWDWSCPLWTARVGAENQVKVLWKTARTLNYQAIARVLHFIFFTNTIKVQWKRNMGEDLNAL